MKPIIPENKKISPFLVFFVINSMQTGVGVLGFQRIIAKSAGYDGWIAIIFASICIHFVLWMMYKMLEIADGDLISIHTFVFGKTAGKLLSSIFILYFCSLTVTTLRNFIEIVQVWMFSDLITFWFALVFLILVIYIINGGFRTITGIGLFSVILPSYIWLLFLFTIPFADFTNLLPIFNHSAKDILIASKDMSLSFIGFETLLFFYPFIKNPERSKKWSHLAIFFLTMIYLYLTILTFAYFPQEQLQKNIWPTLTMWKIIELPFVERFEYIGIANWCLIILPNTCIALWIASRLTKQLFSVKQRLSAPILAVFCLIGTSLLMTRDQINFLTNFVGQCGFYINFMYIPLLFIATLIAKKVKEG